MKTNTSVGSDFSSTLPYLKCQETTREVLLNASSSPAEVSNQSNPIKSIQTNQTTTYDEDNGEPKARNDNKSHTVNKPGKPMNGITQTHGAHRFLQPPLFLMDYRLDDHSGRVNKRENHKEREQLRNGYEKRVEDVARRRELLHEHSGQFFSLAVMRHDGPLDHVLQVNETRSEVSHVDAGVDSRYRSAEDIAYPFRRIYLVTVHSK